MELKNRFSSLAVDEDEADSVVEVMERRWKNLKEAYNETAEKVLGFQKRKNKPWISLESWKKVDERKELRKKVDDSKSVRIKERRKVEYTEKAREVKRSLQQDKRK